MADSAEMGVSPPELAPEPESQTRRHRSRFASGQELLSATLFPVGQQNSDHVLLEKSKKGNPPCAMIVAQFEPRHMVRDNPRTAGMSKESGQRMATAAPLSPLRRPTGRYSGSPDAHDMDLRPAGHQHGERNHLW